METFLVKWQNYITSSPLNQNGLNLSFLAQLLEVLYKIYHYQHFGIWVLWSNVIQCIFTLNHHCIICEIISRDLEYWLPKTCVFMVESELQTPGPGLGLGCVNSEEGVCAVLLQTGRFPPSLLVEISVVPPKTLKHSWFWGSDHQKYPFIKQYSRRERPL